MRQVRVRVPLRCLPLFWALAIVAVLSGWGWWHSTRYLTTLRCGNVALMNAGSQVSVGKIRNPGIWWEFRNASLIGYESSELVRFGTPKLLREEPVVVAAGPPMKCGGNLRITLDESLFVSAVP